MAYNSLLSSSSGQMFYHQLDPVRGWWHERQLSRVVARAADANQPATYGIASAVTIYPGMVGFLDANNEFVFAPASGTSQTNRVPLFVRTGEYDNDAVRVEGNMASQRSPIPSALTPTGATLSNVKDVGLSCLVGTADYELGTTEFTGSTPAPGALLFAAKAATGDTGKLTTIAAGSLNAFYGSGSGTDKMMPIGFSTGVTKNQHNISMLYFYTCAWPSA